MENSVKISALAITLNEAEVIEDFIKSLWFADEIIIVDSYSTDATVALASQHEKVKVVKRKFDNFSEQMSSNSLLNRVGKMEEMAGIAIYLCSQAGAYTHGTIIPVDGGTSINHQHTSI